MTTDLGSELLEPVPDPPEKRTRPAASLTQSAATAMWDGWLRMWNVDPRAAFEIIGQDYQVHLPSISATVDVDAIRDAAGMASWVSGFRDRFDGLHYRTNHGPFVDGDTVICRWVGTAVFRGRTGWHSDVPGASVMWVGVDILRIADGRIVEAWTQAAETTRP